MRLVPYPVRHLCAALAGAALAMYSLSAHASFQSDITVKLISPGGYQGDATPIAVQQLVTVADLATGVQAGDAGAIGGSWMLAGEEVSFVGNSIHVRSYAGYDDATGIYTGYLGSGGAPARYEFDGLSIAGKVITGFSVYAFDGYGTTGFTGLLTPSASSLVDLIGTDTIALDLSSILFKARSGGTSASHADFRIDLDTRDAGGTNPPDPGTPGNPVPEPATLALLLAAALGAGAARRRA